MRQITVPVTTGGKIFFSCLLGKKLRPIEVKEQSAMVPINIPYASGQAPLTVTPLTTEDGQVPSA